MAVLLIMETPAAVVDGAVLPVAVVHLPGTGDPQTEEEDHHPAGVLQEDPKEDSRL